MVEPIITRGNSSNGYTSYKVSGQNSYGENNRPSTGSVTATDTTSGNHLFLVSGSGVSNLGIPEEAFPDRDGIMNIFEKNKMTSTAKAIAILDKDDRLVGYFLGRLNNSADELTVDRIYYTNGKVERLSEREKIGLNNDLFDAKTAEYLSQLAIRNATEHNGYAAIKKETTPNNSPNTIEVAGSLCSPKTPTISAANNVCR